MPTTIHNIHAREILDSRGHPTVEVDVFLSSGAWGRASVPSGASTGEHEALELRDNAAHFKTLIHHSDPKKRYHGKGVIKAVSNIHQIIAPSLLGKDPFNQVDIDHTMIQLDGTPNKHNLGANAILGVSLAVAKASANALQMPLYKYLGGPNTTLLPVPLMNILNGGSHSDAPIDIQEFMIVPKGASSFAHALQMGAEVFHTLKKILKEKGLSTSIGDEGGFAPKLLNNEDAIETIIKAIKESGYLIEKDFYLALDVAASEFYDASKKTYTFHKSDQSTRSSKEMIDLYTQWTQKYPIISIEDACDQNDWDGWKHLTQSLGKSIQLVGDDLFVTNTHFLKKGIQEHVANAILIKVNQIGTLTETLNAVYMAQKAGYKAIISHRSGETEDTTIADIAVATHAGQIKTGSLCRTDRVCKYNQLLRIEESLGIHALYAGKL